MAVSAVRSCVRSGADYWMFARSRWRGCCNIWSARRWRRATCSRLHFESISKMIKTRQVRKCWRCSTLKDFPLEGFYFDEATGSWALRSPVWHVLMRWHSGQMDDTLSWILIICSGHHSTFFYIWIISLKYECDCDTVLVLVVSMCTIHSSHR